MVNSGNGFDMQLRHPPSKEAWIYVEGTLTARSAPTANVFAIDYELSAEGRWYSSLSRVVRIDAEVRKLKMYM
ncbi:hypothetical protein C5D50_08770 [Rathayibacter sp. RFBD1]|nr:hypothetical protein C5D50_08770 [Rathayibacter sp. RFBD1]PPI57280.1 hypothetical protein C5D38_08350 [Rathayibacter sp. TRS19]